MSDAVDSEEWNLQVGLDEPLDELNLRRRLARKQGCAETDLPPLRVLRRSIDARGGRVRISLLVGRRTDLPGTLATPPPQQVDSQQRVLIVGAGPAGLFCAYQLARAGIGCAVVERGRKVQPRRRDLKKLQQQGVVDPHSNYCFGEGGAGTYSDGKLYTRSHKRGPVRDVLEILAAHGAPEDILQDARPHIGSNRLPKVITAMRESLEDVGVRFLFEHHVREIRRDGQALRGVELSNGDGLDGSHVVIATGHSARDVFEMLQRAGCRLQPKGFALGVRIEHPQALIDQIQYGKHAGHASLPSASYRFAHTEEQRGTFSFCMCPGGFIVPASTETGALVVNGMSLSRRDSPHANSGLVVGVEPEDVAAAGFGEDPLAGLRLQARLERAAFEAGGGKLRAPAQRVTDFLANRPSTDLPDTSYQPGLQPALLDELLAVSELPLATRIGRALQVCDRRMKGYVTAEAVLVGVESRTSSPVRVPRDGSRLDSPDLPGLYPCGEGAGYAGGIVSAALDGIRVAEAIRADLG